MFKKTCLLAGFCCLIFLAGCNLYSGSPAVSTTPVPGDTVTISNFTFTPGVLEVAANTKVVWKNKDNVTHKLASAGLFESPVLKQGEQFSFTFSAPGNYDYYCSIHPSMKGKIIVK